MHIIIVMYGTYSGQRQRVVKPSLYVSLPWILNGAKKSIGFYVCGFFPLVPENNKLKTIGSHDISVYLEFNGDGTI